MYLSAQVLNVIQLHSDYYLTKYNSPLFSELKFLKVKDIFSLTKLLFIFDFINKKVPESMFTSPSSLSHRCDSSYKNALAPNT